MQTNCTKNEDSLYFNSQLPPPNAPQTWPEVVTNAFAEANKDEPEDDDEEMAGNSKDEEDAPVSQLIDIDLPPPLPPKARSAFGGARPKRRSNNNSGGSIVGKYLGSKGQDKSDDSPSPRVVEKQSKKGPAPNPPSPSSRKFSVDSYLANAQPSENLENSFLKASPTLNTKSAALDANKPQITPTFDSAYQPGSFSTKVNSKGQTKDILFGTRPKTRPVETLPDLNLPLPSARVLKNRVVNPERDAAERDKLREMLSTLRKDPFDEDLEENDGSFFPCEFCGDPYPVEFLMRHQVSLEVKITLNMNNKGVGRTIVMSVNVHIECTSSSSLSYFFQPVLSFHFSLGCAYTG